MLFISWYNISRSKIIPTNRSSKSKRIFQLLDHPRFWGVGSYVSRRFFPRYLTKNQGCKLLNSNKQPSKLRDLICLQTPKRQPSINPFQNKNMQIEVTHNFPPPTHTIPSAKRQLKKKQHGIDIPRHTLAAVQPYTNPPRTAPLTRPYARPSNLLVDHTLNHPRYEDCRPAPGCLVAWRFEHVWFKAKKGGG